MDANSDGEEIRRTIQRISKIKLSSEIEELFTNIILTYSYSPKNNMTEEEFLKIKIRLVNRNKKDDLLETFLNKNKILNIKKKLFNIS